ncbi:hypothetical protein Tco_0236351 [Tanacetum coccineum]
MKDAEVADSGKDDEEITDVEKVEVGKSKEVKGDNKKAELPPTSYSLSVSSEFGNQFLTLSSNIFLTRTLKDTTDADINSLLDIQIQQEVPHIQSPSILTIPVSMIPNPTVLSPIPEIPLVTPSTTLPPPPPVTNLTPIHSILLLKGSQVPAAIDEYLGSSLGDALQKVLQKHTEELIQQSSKTDVSRIIKIKQEQVAKEKIPKLSATPYDQAAKEEFKQKEILFKMTTKSKSYEKHPKHKALYDVLVLLLIQDEDDLDRVIPYLRKRDREEDEEPSAGSNQGKRKRRLGKDSEPSNTSSASKETSKGDTPPKSSKTGKYASVKESVKEATHETDNAPKKNCSTQPPRPSTPDLEWNKCQVVDNQPKQTWFNDMMSATKDPLTFDELMATPINFFNFAKNRLKLDKITKENLVGPQTSSTERSSRSSNRSYRILLKQRSGVLEIYRFRKEVYYVNYKDEGYKILSVVSVKVKNLHGYGYLEEIVDMLLLVVQRKLFHLDGEVIVDLAVALSMFTRSLIIKKRVEDVQLGVESYQKKLNITKPQKDFPRISAKELYTPYGDLSHQKRLMRADELYKFLDGTLKKVHDTLHHRLLNFRFGYNKDMPRRKWSDSDKRQSIIMVDLIDKQMLERRILRNLERLVGARELEMDYSLDRSMDSDKYLEGQSMQRPPLFESDSFIYWKNRFETYVKSKDLDLWHVITNGDFQPIIQNPETKLDEVVPFEKQTDDLKRRLAKNNEAKMVIYNALPRKEYERIFMCNTAKEIWKTLLITHQGNSQVQDNKIDLLVQQYEQFIISKDESIDSAFARFNTLFHYLKSS